MDEMDEMDGLVINLDGRKMEEQPKSGVRLGGHFIVECYGPDGKLKWVETTKNLVPNIGLQHILDVVFVGGSANPDVAPWYVGLIDGSDSAQTLAAGDTLAAHAGWTENTNYTGNRKEYVEVRSGQSLTNAASKASFAIDTNSQQIAGAFLCAIASGTGGVLMAEAAFTGGEKNVDNGDTLEVTYTYSAADDGV